MRQALSIFLLLMALVASAQQAEVTKTVECGTWVTIKAASIEGYKFDAWTDGNIEPIRRIQVNEDATYIALFTSICGDLADLPVVVRYDWLFMLNVKECRLSGYTVAPDYVTWYRVVGEPDDLGVARSEWDDEVVGRGYSLSLDKNFEGTGDYYCTLDVDSGPASTYCNGKLRSRIISYSTPTSPSQRVIRLLPNVADKGQTVRVVGLDPNSEAAIRVYSVTGQLLGTYASAQEEIFLLDAMRVTGCYEVVVQENGEQTVLRYLVR